MPRLVALQERLASARPGPSLSIDGGPRVTFAQRVIELLLPRLVTAVVVRDYRGAEHVPRRGGVIVAANHVSDADPFVLADFLLRRGRHAHFLAKQALFAAPVVGWFLKQALMIAVRRDSVVAAGVLDQATAAVRAGAAVGIYPEGKETLDPGYWPMRGRHGVAAVALATGAPVIPVVQWGTQQIRGHEVDLHLLPRTHVSVWAGEPVDLSRWADAPFTEQVLSEMTEAVMAAVLELERAVREECPLPEMLPTAS